MKSRRGLQRTPAFSLVPQRVDGIEKCRFSSRIEAKKDANQRRKEEGQQNGPWADQRRPLGEIGNQLRGQDADDDPNDATQNRKRNGLHQELSEDIFRFGAYGLP